MEAPGKAYRKGISLKKIMDMFATDEVARDWLESVLWPDGPYCPDCGSFNVQTGIRHKTMTHRCRECRDRPQFSLKSGTVMKSTKLGYRDWAIAIYLLTTSLKGVSSMKLHRDLEITQKSAWHLLHRLRRAFEAGEMTPFTGPVEIDETYMGGKRKNMSNAQRKEAVGRGTAGKSIVAGAKDRKTNQVMARTVPDTTQDTLQGFVAETVADDATVYTDEHSAYAGIPNPHETVNHSSQQYVDGQIHTNGIESFWAMFKRAHKGTYHKMSPKHLQRYITEFAGRHNMREGDTMEQLELIATRMAGKRLTYTALKADNGLSNAAH